MKGTSSELMDQKANLSLYLFIQNFLCGFYINKREKCKKSNKISLLFNSKVIYYNSTTTIIFEVRFAFKVRRILLIISYKI